MDTKHIIKSLRIDKKATQEELAKYCGVTRSTVANWEAGKRKPDVATLKLIASYFDVSLNFLTGTEKEVNKDFVHKAKAYFMADEIKQDEKDKIIQEVMRYYFTSKEGAGNKNDKENSEYNR